MPFAGSPQDSDCEGLRLMPRSRCFGLTPQTYMAQIVLLLAQPKKCRLLILACEGITWETRYDSRALKQLCSDVVDSFSCKGLLHKVARCV
jgi:hypothetical protein